MFNDTANQRHWTANCHLTIIELSTARPNIPTLSPVRFLLGTDVYMCGNWHARTGADANLRHRLKHRRPRSRCVLSKPWLSASTQPAIPTAFHPPIAVLESWVSPLTLGVFYLVREFTEIEDYVHLQSLVWLVNLGVAVGDLCCCVDCENA